MTRIGLLSDTHAYLDPRVLEHFRDVDEIWHAGDIGTMEVLQSLREFKPTRAVFGNMDGGDVRYSLSEFYRFRVEDVQVLLTHIGGYPGHYNPWLLPMFQKSLLSIQSQESLDPLSPLSPLSLLDPLVPLDPLDPLKKQEPGVSSAPHNSPFSRTIPEPTSNFSRTTPEPTPNPSRDRIDLFVCGHSHILKVQYDSHYRFLMMNPGAAGTQGWQTVQTLLRFVIDGSQIRDLEVIELERR